MTTDVRMRREEDRMKLPQFRRAVVPKRKLVAYLLSEDHPDGSGKARWLRQYGFTPQNWRALAVALKRHAKEQSVASMQDSAFGTRYTLVGRLESPDGRNPSVRSVWFVETGGTIPRLVTAYPARRGRT